MNRFHYASILIVALAVAGCRVEATSHETDSPVGDVSGEPAVVITPEAIEESVQDDAGPAGGWGLAAPMSVPRSELGAAEISGLIYAVGGFGGPDVLSVYDPQADSWTRLADLPEGRNHAAVAALDGKLYVAGGGEETSFAPTSTLFIYNPATDTWAQGVDLPALRLGAGAAALDGMLYVAGGQGALAARVAFRYDPAADAWEEIAEMETVRDHVAVTTFDGKVYAIGGRAGNAFFHTSVEIYDPATGTWEIGPDMNEARSGVGAAVLDGKIYVAGGEVFAPEAMALDSVEVFDPQSDSWTLIEALPYGIHGHPVVTADGRIWVVGGSDVAAQAVNSGRMAYLEPWK